MCGLIGLICGWPATEEAAIFGADFGQILEVPHQVSAVKFRLGATWLTQSLSHKLDDEGQPNVGIHTKMPM